MGENGFGICRFHMSFLAMAEFNLLMGMLQEVRPIRFVRDNHVWWKCGARFLVKHSYNILVSLEQSESTMEMEVLQVLKELWKSKLPCKIQIFIRRLLINKL